MSTSANSTGPSHYRRGSIEVWDFIRDQDLNYFLGNAIKYITRAGHKTDSPVEDLKKAIHYLTKELEHVQQQQSKHHFVPNPIFSPGIQWSTGTGIQDSDGFSHWDAAE